jgi:hypothetical protein
MFSNDEWLLKDGLVFAHMGKGLCYPIILKGLEGHYALDILENLENKIAIRDKRLSEGIGYYSAQRNMSVQRVFHISRVQEFDVIQLADLKVRLLDENRENRAY